MAVSGGEILSVEEVLATGEYTDEIQFSSVGYGGYTTLTVQVTGLTGTVTVEGYLSEDQWDQLGGLTALSAGGTDGDSITADGIYQGQYLGVTKIRVKYVGSALTTLKAVAVA